jgi:hypothetical protein
VADTDVVGGRKSISYITENACSFSRSQKVRTHPVSKRLAWNPLVGDPRGVLVDLSLQNLGYVRVNDALSYAKLLFGSFVRLVVEGGHAEDLQRNLETGLIHGLIDVCLTACTNTVDDRETPKLRPGQ